MFKNFRIYKILAQALLAVLLISTASFSFAQNTAFEAAVLSSLNNIKATLSSNNRFFSAISTTVGEIFNDVHKIYKMFVDLPKEQGKVQVRYIEAGQVLTPFIQQQNSDLTNKFSNFIQYGQFTDSPDKSQQVSLTQTMKEAQKQPNEYTASDGTSYSTTSAQSLLSANMYNAGDRKKAQQNAAIDFIKNASGTYFAVPALPKPSKKGAVSDERLKYNAYQKMMASIQSLTAANYISNYVDRLPKRISEAGSETSYMRLLNNMNTAEPSNPDYWDSRKGGTGSKSLFARAQAFFTSFFSINYTLHDIDKQLQHMNLQLAAITTEYALSLQQTVGEQLYNAVQREEQEQAKFADEK